MKNAAVPDYDADISNDVLGENERLQQYHTIRFRQFTAPLLPTSSQSQPALAGSIGIGW